MVAWSGVGLSCSATFSQQSTSALMISGSQGELGRILGQQLANMACRALMDESRVVGDEGAKGSVMIVDTIGIRSYVSFSKMLDRVICHSDVSRPSIYPVFVGGVCVCV